MSWRRPLCATAVLIAACSVATAWPGKAASAAGVQAGGSARSILTHALFRAIAVEPDGRIVAIGCQGSALAQKIPDRYLVVRYTTKGFLDPSFGGDGLVLLRPTEYPEARGCTRFVHVQASGRILVGGDWSSPQGGFLVTLGLKSDGSLDPSFGAEGSVRLDPSASPQFATRGNQLVMAGSETTPSGVQFVAASFDGDGQPNLSFGGDGRAETNFGNVDEEVLGLALQSDGKVVVAGHVSDVEGGYEPNSFRGLLARFGTNGELDPSFGDGGVVTNSDLQSFSEIVIDQRGRVLANLGQRCFELYPCFLRVRSDGFADTSFGGDGLVILRRFGDARGVFLGPRAGSSVLIGLGFGERYLRAYLDSHGRARPASITESRIHRLPRITTEGAPVFAAGGTRKVLIPSYRCGERLCTEGVTRLNRDGSLDRGFGRNGFTPPAPK